MNPEEYIKQMQDLTKIVDGLLMRSLRNRSWIVALTQHILETNKESKELVKSKLKERQKRALQKLLEEIENKDPAYAAELDNRSMDDL
jgi:hypothetical protein